MCVQETFLYMYLCVQRCSSTSSKYKVTARVIDGAEDIRTLIGWSRDIDKILAGLNLNQDAQLWPLSPLCLESLRGGN